MAVTLYNPVPHLHLSMHACLHTVRRTSYHARLPEIGHGFWKHQAFSAAFATVAGSVHRRQLLGSPIPSRHRHPDTARAPQSLMSPGAGLPQPVWCLCSPAGKTVAVLGPWELCHWTEADSSWGTQASGGQQGDTNTNTLKHLFLKSCRSLLL